MALTSRPAPKQEKSSPALQLDMSSLFQRQTINAKDRRFFTEQLALLLETGSSLQEALGALQRQVDKPAMRELVQMLRDDVEQGMQLSRAMAKHPQVFSTTYTNLIAASEDGGFMHEVLDQLLEMEAKREELRQILVSALSYPLFLIVFALGVIVFVLLVVFPKFADLFELIADELPGSTKVLMAISDVLANHGITLGIALGLMVIGFRLWARTQQGKRSLDWSKLYMPLLGNIFVQLYLVQSLRVLSLSLGNGVNIMDALHSCREVVNNGLFRRFIKQVESNVEQGKGVALGFEESHFIPPVVAQMIKTGEDSGNLPRVLRRLADYYENELTQLLRTVSKMAEPFMLLIMGGVVGLIVSSLILPIFKLSRAVT